MSELYKNKKMSSQTILQYLQTTFGKIPDLIQENLKYLTYDDENDYFICTHCDKIIRKVYNNKYSTTKNFEQHLLSNTHTYNTVTDHELWRNLNITFKGNIPQIVKNNHSVLGIDGEYYECAICLKTLLESSSILATENNFSYHLLSSSHKDKLVEYKKNFNQLHEVYGGIPSFILNHKQFLSKKGMHYFCTICERSLKVYPTDVNETEKSFERHLHSLKHTRNAKQAKAFSLIPQLKQIFSYLPNYMLRNVEYISMNGLNYFCSLCNENIKNSYHNLWEMRQNFKLHISSFVHEEKLRNRRNPYNDVFKRLHSIFETFPDFVLDNLKYLVIDEDDFFCSICKETIFQDDEDSKRTEKNLIFHFESVYHKKNVKYKLKQCSDVIEDLKDVFGSVPQLIQDNIEHIQFIGGKDFECTLCNKIMKAKIDGDYDLNSYVTEENFKSHLNSNKHEQELSTLNKFSSKLETDLKGLFTCIPQFILNNMDHLGDGDDDDFYCYLCEKTIALANGNKKEERTRQNFRNHVLSADHMAKLKDKANMNMETTEELELIFYKIPNFVLNNIEHLEISGEGHYFCTLCDAQIMKGNSESTEIKFREHLYGSRHKLNLEGFEDDNDEALQRLDCKFWRIPEIILRNIDFCMTTIHDKDLFCTLCQEILYIDEDDLKSTKKSLRCHLDSSQHQSNLKSI